MIGEILLAIGFGAAYVTADKIGRNGNPKPPAPHEVDLLTLTAYIGRLYRTAERVQTLDRMITDIQICDPETLRKSFRTEWESGGQNRDYQFWTSGADINADHLLRMALDEREQLLDSLLSQIDDISAVRWQKNGRKTLFRPPVLTAGEGTPQLLWEEAEQNG